LAGGSTFNTHILAIDYRGFGSSTGFPTEEGLTIDGIAAVNWAMEIATVPPNRIVILGHSLGTAVTAAVIEHFAQRGTEFAGVVLLAGFTDLKNLLADYCLVGWLAPLRSYPRLLKYFTDRLLDTWPTADRISNFVRLSKRVRLFILHSLDDYEIRPHHSDGLFTFAANATVDPRLPPQVLQGIKVQNTVYMDDGTYISTCNHVDDDKIIIEQVLPSGCSCFIL
jgi:pimeloyl-ACP methyl ester carboxylesterase